VTYGSVYPYRSFGMDTNSGRLYPQLDPIELDVTQDIHTFIGPYSINIRKYQAEYTEQVSHQIGRRINEGWEANLSDSKGLLIYGPNLVIVPSGRHEIQWNLFIDNIIVNYLII